jgi:hypothetical protein
MPFFVFQDKIIYPKAEKAGTHLPLAQNSTKILKSEQGTHKNTLYPQLC